MQKNILEAIDERNKKLYTDVPNKFTSLSLKSQKRDFLTYQPNMIEHNIKKVKLNEYQQKYLHKKLNTRQEDFSDFCKTLDILETKFKEKLDKQIQYQKRIRCYSLI